MRRAFVPAFVLLLAATAAAVYVQGSGTPAPSAAWMTAGNILAETRPAASKQVLINVTCAQTGVCLGGYGHTIPAAG